MFVHIVLRGLNIERVFVRGLDEEDQMNGLDLSTESQYKVMRMVTDHAAAASLHYFHSNTHQNAFDTVLRTFLHWLRYKIRVPHSRIYFFFLDHSNHYFLNHANVVRNF